MRGSGHRDLARLAVKEACDTQRALFDPKKNARQAPGVGRLSQRMELQHKLSVEGKPHRALKEAFVSKLRRYGFARSATELWAPCCGLPLPLALAYGGFRLESRMGLRILVKDEDNSFANRTSATHRFVGLHSRTTVCPAAALRSRTLRPRGAAAPPPRYGPFESAPQLPLSCVLLHCLDPGVPLPVLAL